MPDTIETPGNAALPPSQEGQLIAIDTPLGPDRLLLAGFVGTEAVSAGFTCRAEVLTRAAEADMRTLLGKPVTIWLGKASDPTRRPLHGHVRQLARQGTDARGWQRWQAEIVPWTWFLGCTSDCRVFQTLSIPEIVRSVFDSFGFNNYELRLHTEYAKLEYCVQYCESALNFVCRLLEHVGIFTWFEHHADRHVLVLADGNRATRMMDPPTVKLAMRGDLGEILDMNHQFALQPGVWALGDYDFEMPTKNLHTREPSTLPHQLMRNFEIFDFPGGYHKRDDGARLTRLRMEQQEVGHHTVTGSGTSAGFGAGRRFRLESQHSQPTADGSVFLLTEVTHRATAAYPFADSTAVSGYANSFTGIPAAHVFRPARVTPRPRMPGPQTATVMGPAGEAIHTDKYGRVKLHFHWDRHGKTDDTSSCWVRVSQHSASGQWGAVAIPHVGDEVVVDFLNGDPDRPIVTGRVHNGTHMPPINLPQDKHKTVIRDHGDNRIVMHGKAGQERLSMVSPKNINFVAMRSAAKGLSAQIDGVSFDDYEDSASLGELLNVFNELTQKKAGKVPTPDPNTLAQEEGGTIPTSYGNNAGTDSAANVDINTMSEHDINSLSVGNTNSWVGGDLNTWVAKEAHTYVGASSFSVYAGPLVSNIVHFVQNDAITLHMEETGAHIELTLAHAEATDAHVEATGAHSEVTGLHTEYTDMHCETTAGAHYETNLGPHFVIQGPVSSNYTWSSDQKHYIKDEDSIKASWKVKSNLISFKAQAEPISSDYPLPTDLATQMTHTAAMPPPSAATGDLLVASLLTPAPPMAPGQFEVTCELADIQANQQMNIDGGLMISLKAEVGVTVNGKMIKLG